MSFAASRRRVALAALLATAALWAVAAPSTGADPARYYVALGDSLARGWQPDPDGSGTSATVQGYVNDVMGKLRRYQPRLRLENLGCGGETAESMANGGICHYLAGSQIAQAEAFIQAHPGSIAAITINIGDNDVENCLATGQIQAQCLRTGFGNVRTLLPQIVARLRAAAGPRVPIVGLSDYDQFLAYWLKGGSARDFALQTVPLIRRLNGLVQGVYRHRGVRVADGGRAFASDDLVHLGQLRGHGSVPLAVQRVCLWTWACSDPPIGFNDHPNSTGYAVLADTVLAALRKR